MANENEIIARLILESDEFIQGINKADKALQTFQISGKKGASNLEAISKELAGTEEFAKGAGAAIAAMTAKQKLQTTVTRVQTAMMNTLAKSYRFIRGSLYAASIQLQDFAVQVSSGTSALVAFSQNAPQFLANFGGIGAAVGAVIAALPLLALAFRDLGNDIKTVNRIIGEFNDKLSEVQKMQQSLSLTGAEFMREYGAATQQFRDQLQLLTELEITNLEIKLAELGEKIRLDGEFKAMASETENAFRRIELMFGLVGEEAQTLNLRFRELAAAETLETQVAAAQRLVAALQATGIPLNKIPANLREALTQMLQTNAALQRARVELQGLAGTSERIKTILGALKAAAAAISFEAPNTGASRLSRILDGVVSKLNAISSFFTKLGKQAKAREGIENMQRGFDMEAYGQAQAAMREQLARVAAGEDILGTGGGEGGGGGGGDPLAELRSQLESTAALLDQYRLSETEKGLKEFELRQQILEEALEKQLITQQRYEELMRANAEKHAEDIIEIERRKRDAQLGAVSSIFGSLAKIAQAGGKKMAKAAATFGAIEATVNAYRAASQVLANPDAFTPAEKFAAYASVLAAGLQGVAAIRSAGSSVGAGGGGGGISGAVSGAVAAPQVSRNVAIQLTGGDMFSRDQVVGLINQINEAVEDGAVVRLV